MAPAGPANQSALTRETPTATAMNTTSPSNARTTASPEAKMGYTNPFSIACQAPGQYARGYSGAIDMLTRTSTDDDFAPDGSVFPTERDPVTGGRKLEEIAFEIASKQSLTVPTRKARKLVKRGVRRVFCIARDNRRGLEW